MKQATRLEFQLELEGQGLVNYNGDKPHKRFIGDMIVNGKVTGNGAFAKENTYKPQTTPQDGSKKDELISKKIISSNLLRKQILGDENDVNADKLSKIDSLRVAYLSQDNVIARGYCILGRKGTSDDSVKRASAFTILDAEQISDTVTWLETRTTEGERGENSLFFKETCGKIEYKTDVCVDIKQLQFISIDDNYDRCAVSERDVTNYINHLESRYGKDAAKFGNWATTHTNVIGEQGIVLSSKVSTNIIREMVKKMLNIHIQRAGAYAKTKSIKLSIGYKGEALSLNSKPAFFSFNNIEEYDTLVKDVEFGVEFIPVITPTVIRVEKVEETDKPIKEKTKKMGK